MTYVERLKDPRWQKRRLQILERDGWRCTACDDEKATLHVHHRYYERSKLPWEYPDDALATLCEPCHEVETHQSREIAGLLSRLVCAAQKDALIGYLRATVYATDAAGIPVGKDGERGSIARASGAADWLGVDRDAVIASANSNAGIIPVDDWMPWTMR